MNDDFQSYKIFVRPFACSRFTHFWYRVMKSLEIFCPGSSMLSFASYRYKRTMYFLFRSRPLCLITRSTAHSDGDVETLLTLSGVFFCCSSCVMRVSFSNERGISTVTGCSFSLQDAVTWYMDTVFGTSSSSISTVWGCTSMIRIGLEFGG